MNFIPLANSLNRLFGNSRYTTNPQFNGVNILMNNSNGEYLDPENIDAFDVYSTTPHLYAVVKKKGDLLASGQWKHIKVIGGVETEVLNSEIIKVLENPNVLYNGNEYLKLLNENRCVYGNEYKYLLRPFKKALPSCIYVLPSYDIKIITTGKWYNQSKLTDIIKFYEYISRNNERIEVEDINHTWINNSKNPLMGETPLKNIYMPVSNLRLGLKTRNILMNKRGALGILANDTKDSIGHKSVGKEERLKIEQQYQKDYGLNDSQAQIIISDSNLKWQAMGFPTKDLLLFEEDENDFQMICDNYGIDRNLFAQDNKATFNNQSEAIKQTYQITIIPEAEEIAMTHTNIFGLNGVTEYLKLDYSHIPALQDNQKEQAEIIKLKADSIKTLKDSGFTTDQITTITGITL